MLTTLARLGILRSGGIVDRSMHDSLVLRTFLIINTLEAFELFEDNDFVLRHIWVVVPLVSWVELERGLAGWGLGGCEAVKSGGHDVIHFDGVGVEEGQWLGLAGPLHVNRSPETNRLVTGNLWIIIFLSPLF